MDIPFDAEVQCFDGVYGYSTSIVLDPISREVTHMVVKPSGTFDDEDRVIPIGYISLSSSHKIYLKCSRESLTRMKTLAESRLVASPSDPRVMMRPHV